MAPGGGIRAPPGTCCSDYIYWCLNYKNLSLKAIMKLKHWFSLQKYYNDIGRVSDCKSRDREFEPEPGRIILVEIDREIISTAILSLSLVHKGQLSVTGVKVCALGTV